MSKIITVPEQTVSATFEITYPSFQIVIPDDESVPELLRGVRGQASSCSTAAKCDARLDCLQAAGVTAYLYPVWYYGWYYRTKLDEHRDFDSLAHLVPAAHARGIEVLPLIVAAYVPLASHPEWNARITQPGVSVDWLDFTIPEARQFVADVAAELADNYDVDGILLDYIRWPGDDLLPSDAVAETVQLVGQAIPNEALGASVLADPVYAKCQGQDWMHWLADGYLDFANPMAYYGDTILRSLLQSWNDSGFFPNRIIPRLSTCIFNPAFKVKPVADVLRQIDICHAAGSVDVTLWDDRYLCNNPALIETLGGGGW